jgi:serine/threonine-protein kinase
MEPVVDPRIYSNRYQVTHLIARGGMALVYRAHDLLLNRYVALKILYPELSVDQTFVERFRREAQAAANLSHPNIVPIFDWGEDNGTYFIVMELIEGTSLADLLRDSRTLSPAKSAQVCAQVASALSYAHRQGVVHRDVKPGNILLTSDGQVKVTDFGIAQAISTEDNLTVAGSVMGTATYFSPEQAEGAMVDGRSDVYSLGVVLYELLAGRPPFIGESPVAVASKHVRETVPSPKTFNPQLPTDLELVTMHALAKQPADRYQSADEFRADLLRFSEGQPISIAGAAARDDVTRAVAVVSAGERTQAVPIQSGPRTDIKKRRNNGGIIAIIVVLILLIGGGIIFALSSSSSATNMPSLIGLSANTAESVLANDGLGFPTLVVHNNKALRGTIYRTNPAAGHKVTKGKKVILYVSLGPPTSLPVKVPNVLGQNVATAQTNLTNAGLNDRIVFSLTPVQGASANQVIGENPPGGAEAKLGAYITLTVLSPDANVFVPSVVGDSTTAAANILGSAGLLVASTNTTQCSNTIPSGMVVKTSPNANASVPSGSTITLVTSTGVCNVLVPTVSGSVSDTEVYASNTLQQYGFIANFVQLDSTDTRCLGQSDYVVDQDPLGGTQAPYGSTVTMNYCPPAG